MTLLVSSDLQFYRNRPPLLSGWVTIQGLDVNAVATNTVKSRKRRNGASIKSLWGQKKINKIKIKRFMSSINSGAYIIPQGPSKLGLKLRIKEYMFAF